MILGGQILVILNYRLTVLRPMVDILYLQMQYVWNHSQSCHQNVIFRHLKVNKLKKILITFSLNRYN